MEDNDEELKVEITCPLCGHKQQYDVVFEDEIKEEDEANAS
jgi:rubredoxin